MVGVFAIIIIFICWIVNGNNEYKMDSYRKSQSQDPFLWTDSRGRRRLKSNNKIAVDFVAPWNGHTYVKDKKGNILFDATERAAKIEAEKHPVDYTTDTLEGYPIRIYEKQDKNGKIKHYTIMRFRDADLIVNLDTMRVERPTDDQLRFELDCKKRGYLSYSEKGFRDMIRDFNLKKEFDRRSIIGECNIQGLKKNSGTYWCNTIYQHRLPNRNDPRDFDRPWIK